MYTMKATVNYTFLRNRTWYNIWQCRSNFSTSFALSINHASEEYQFIERSKVPTLHFQKSLPRLPIPELKKTCERYLAAQTPILSCAELIETTKLVKEFETGEGRVLDDRLRIKDAHNKHTSYISEPWYDMYLRDRAPLPLNYNPALVFVNAPSQFNTPLIRTTNLIISSLRFMKSLRAELLSPEVFHLNPAKSDTQFFRNFVRLLPPAVSWYGAYLFKAYPLDMSQYSSLFNSARIPQKEKDILRKDETGRHIMVMRNGHIYKFDVLDQQGNIVPAEDVQTCLRYILEQRQSVNVTSLGVLTGVGRVEWAAAREHISQLNEINAQGFKDIDSALFVVCLDEEAIGENPVLGMRTFLHGDGLNRWFDKSFSLIVTADGVTGLNFEHSWGDGVAVLRYFQDVLKDSTRNHFVSSDTTPSRIVPEDRVKRIVITLDEAGKQSVEKAKADFDARCKALAVDVMQMSGFGKKDCKKAQVSPDSIMQLAFQVAYHQVYNEFVATYESCSTAAFKHGRTETVRPSTTATRDFALAFNKASPPSANELIALMQKCSKVHSQLTKDAAMGCGFDRHLFALRTLSGPSLPAIFQHPSYARMNHNILSTSTLASDAVLYGGFGAVVQDGLGVGYSILDDNCGAVVTSYPPHRDGSTFVSALNDTLKSFAQLLSSK